MAFQIIVAGCKGVEAHLILEAELQVLELGLRLALEMQIQVDYAFTDSMEVCQLITQGNNEATWRVDHRHRELLHLKSFKLSIAFEVIPGDWNQIADKLALHGRHSQMLFQFHRGMELPKWLMKLTKAKRFWF